MLRRVLLVLVWLGSSGCDRVPEQRSSAAVPTVPSVAAPPKSTSRPIRPERRFSVEASAYAVQLGVDDEAIYLATPTALYRQAWSGALERRSLELGAFFSLSERAVVYWSSGALHAVDRRGGDPVTLARGVSEPKRIVARGDRVVWHDAHERDSLWTLDGRKPRRVLESEGAVLALGVDGDRFSFVEARPGGFRIGAGRLDGSEVSYTKDERGRPPSMLAHREGVYFYDGARQVRWLAPDLTEERVIARRVICSPLTVATEVYCAAPGTLSSLPLEGGSSIPLVRGAAGAITQLAASETHVAYVVDAGPDRLAVEAISRGAADR